VGEVVDVFRGAGEMDELAHLHHFRDAGQAVFHPVFDRLDVVVGDLLDILDRLGVGLRKIVRQRVQLCEGSRGEGWNFGDGGLVRERLEPFDFHLDAIADQGILAEIGAQVGYLAVVAPVKRG
jgi:hypothetical protein